MTDTQHSTPNTIDLSRVPLLPASPGGPNGEGYAPLVLDGHLRKANGTCYASCPSDDHR